MLKDLFINSFALYGAIQGNSSLADICEVRIRRNQPVLLKFVAGRKMLSDVIATEQDIMNILSVAGEFSLYAHQDEINRGFIACKDGIRVGIAGRCVTDGNKLLTIKDITSLCIRVPKRVKICDIRLLELAKNFGSTLIVSPPFCGKTTIIRELAAKLSDQEDVVILDERGEISAGGYFNLGEVDVISNAPKKLVYEGVIRAMGASVMVMDEISPEEDLNILGNIACAGVKVLASMHGENADEILAIHPLLKKYFSVFVSLSNKPKVGSIISFVRE